MQHGLSDFIRDGRDGEYVLVARDGGLRGFRPRVSVKSAFPNYSAGRAAFEDRLDQAIRENTLMLLGALTPPDTVHTVTAADLRDLSDARDAALRQWDLRLEAIYAEYYTHPQRLRPLRSAMEDRLLRAFAGLINQLRQQDLGIERYVWRSRDDDKVRSAHAAYDDRTFRWDDPPAGGHPGQAHNCRCIAEPIPLGRPSNVVLADFAPTADGLLNPGTNQGRRLANGLIARTPAGAAIIAALEASDRLQAFTRAVNERRIREGAVALGADLTTVEGLLAAQAYAIGKEFAENGFLSNDLERGDRAKIVAQALGLYEMHQPGLFTLRNDNGVAAAVTARRIAEQALQALEAGRLRPQDGTLADGWVEVFPELTEGERRLGQLPGFTPERLEAFLETYPAEALGLPVHTGQGHPDDPGGNVVSTPIPEDTRPNVVEMPRPGEPTRVRPNNDAETQRGHRRENESAEILAQAGFDVVQNPAVDGPKNPDYMIDGKVYDHYAPTTDNVRRIWERVKEKVDDGQAPNVVIGLQDSAADEDMLRKQFADWPIEGLDEVLIVRGDGTTGRL